MPAVLVIDGMAIGYRGEAEQRDRQAGDDLQGAGVHGPRCGDRAGFPALDESLVRVVGLADAAAGSVERAGEVVPAHAAPRVDRAQSGVRGVHVSHDSVVSL